MRFLVFKIPTRYARARMCALVCACPNEYRNEQRERTRGLGFLFFFLSLSLFRRFFPVLNFDGPSRAQERYLARYDLDMPPEDAIVFLEKRAGPAAQNQYSLMRVRWTVTLWARKGDAKLLRDSQGP